MNQIKKIINDLEIGKLNRNIDETGASGFWDLAGEIATEIMVAENQNRKLEKLGVCYSSDLGNGDVQDMLYDIFYEIYESAFENGRKKIIKIVEANKKLKK